MQIGVFSVHALAMEAARGAFARVWPEVRMHNLLDDAVFENVRRGQSADPATCGLLTRHGRYLQSSGADALLYTCSAFHDCLRRIALTLPLPVLGPNEAMIDAALAMGSRIAILATVPDTLISLEAEIRARAPPGEPRVRVYPHFVEHAFEHLVAGRPDRHDHLVAETAARIHDADVVLLGQFSLVRALPAVLARASVPALAAPDSAVAALRARLTSSGAGP